MVFRAIEQRYNLLFGQHLGFVLLKFRKCYSVTNVARKQVPFACLLERFMQDDMSVTDATRLHTCFRHIRIKILNLFYSYAHEDELFREELEKHLHLLRRQGLIAPWHYRKIIAGAEWGKEIDEHLETASIILLLISSDFLASDYCYDIEMRRALERQKQSDAHIIAIILRPCEWQEAPFAHLQVLPHNGKPVATWESQDAAFLNVTQGIRQVIEQRISTVHLASRLSSLARQHRQRLLKRVRQIWIEGVLERSLQQAGLIDLNLQEYPDALANPWHLEVQETKLPSRSLPTGTSIEKVYADADGELLIVGEPGTGKTTLLLTLARTLLKRAEQEERQCIPVVFPVMDTDP
jgi:hypothetical protein